MEGYFLVDRFVYFFLFSSLAFVASVAFVCVCAFVALPCFTHLSICLSNLSIFLSFFLFIYLSNLT